MHRLRVLILSVLLQLVLFYTGLAQRSYTNRSVLATGSWYKLSTARQGIYRIDAAALTRLGISLPVPSAQIRLFGNGGQMLPEANAPARQDDLAEVAVWMEDGGDGSFSGSDYLLFYAPGQDSWTWDDVGKRYRFQRNLYADSSWFYLKVEGEGRRLKTQAGTLVPNLTVNTYDARWVFEKDTINFLQSGKEWYGEEFGTAPGKLQSRDFTVPMQGAVVGAPVVVYTDVVARAAGQYSRFEVRLNRDLIQDIQVSPLPGVAFEPVAIPATQVSTQAATQNSLLLNLAFFPGSVNGQGWLNQLGVGFRGRLEMRDQGLVFRDRASVGAGNVVQYQVGGGGLGVVVWEVTDPLAPVAMKVVGGSSQFTFNNDASVLREYIAVSPDRYLTPVFTGRVSNQNLHGSPQVPYIIVTHASLLFEANRLAEYHRQNDGLAYVVADVQQIYNEFSSGTPDPSAIRDFVKMFYDRAGADTLQRPKYLLLFGDGSFDYKEKTDSLTNLVPVFESFNSLDPLVSYVSDDFFGLLDDNDDVNSVTPVSYLDIGIGRVPASTVAQAKAYIDKVIAYGKSFGPWRNQMSFVADDEDINTHFNDAEIISKTAGASNEAVNIAKMYLDAYVQESGSGGSRYPQVNEAINRRMFTGNLIWNYSGHGGSSRLAQEAILEADMVNVWSNAQKLPLFITATCDFAPYDDPAIQSLGDNILMRPLTGAIGLMTTTRPVFAFSNRVINNNYLATALYRQPDGKYLTLGEAVKRTKNYTYQTSGDALNNRKFTLLGDPALTLGYPKMKVVTTAINNIAAAAYTDTLKALNRYTITGEVRNLQGVLMTDFSGNVYPVLYDKEQELSTRGNDPGSRVAGFRQQLNPVFAGKAKVQGGKFSYTFIVPKDIDIRTGRGRLSYYADNGATDGAGTETNWYVGGLGNEVKDDGQGPVVRAYLNDEKFVNGGIVNENPVLIVKLTDSSGINTVGTGIGHDLTATLDDDPRKIYILNDFYEADTSFRNGTIRFPLAGLSPGPHNLKIKAWDVFNNSSEQILEFMVAKQEELALKHVLNYPNPFTTNTRFWFEHNRPGEQLQVFIRIMTVTGKVVKTIQRTITTIGNRSDEISWDGRDDYGAKLGRGVYLWQLSVRTSDGKRVQKLEKLVVL
ncbi:MAG: type IX secretion system sortase PorU [Sphingobacteriales bacterium]